MSIRDADSVREDLQALLKRKAEEQGGRAYVRSKFIYDELDSSSKQVGGLIAEIADNGDPYGEISVSRWARTGGYKWEVTLDE